MMGRCCLPSRNSNRTLTFVPEHPAMRIRGLAHGVECFASGQVSMRGKVFFQEFRKWFWKDREIVESGVFSQGGGGRQRLPDLRLRTPHHTQNAKIVRDAPDSVLYCPTNSKIAGTVF